MKQFAFDRDLQKRPYLLFLLSFLFILLLKSFIDPSLLWQPEIWAEAATNYFYQAQTQEWYRALFMTDYGYWPLLGRLWAAVVVAFAVPITWVPLAYQALAMTFIAFCCSVFVLPFFRRALASDFLRLLICLGLALHLDFELHTFVNAPYFGAIPLLLFCFFFQIFQDLSKTKTLFLALSVFVLMNSKALFVTLGPIFVFIVLISWLKKYRAPLWIAVAGIMGATTQSLFLIQASRSGEFPMIFVGKPTPMGFLSTMFNQIFGLFYAQYLGKLVSTRNDLVIYSLLLVFAILFGWLCYKILRGYDHDKKWHLIICFLIAFVTAIINTKTYYEVLPKKLTLNFDYFSTRAWFIACAAIYLQLCLLFWPLVQSKLKNQNSPMRRNFIYAFSFFILFKVTGVFSSSGFFNSSLPYIGFSDWRNYSFLISESPEFYCIPVNPLHWSLQKNCTALKSIPPSVFFNQTWKHQTPQLETVDETLGSSNIQSILFYYPRVSTGNTLKLKLTMKDGTTKLQQGLHNRASTVVSFIFHPPLQNLRSFELQGADGIAFNDGQALFSLFGTTDKPQ